MSKDKADSLKELIALIEERGGENKIPIASFVSSMVFEYAAYFGKPVDEIVQEFEMKREGSLKNYYTPRNFPFLQDVKQGRLFVFDNAQAFVDAYEAFECPQCHTIGKNPSYCSNTLPNSACSVLPSGYSVILKDHGFRPIPCLKPLKKEDMPIAEIENQAEATPKKERKNAKKKL